ncbi:MAG: alkaline phosphatase family protein [Armatimonadota bacterium]|nr:alkaline phosphatase family protein [Armatimonadota bacterium]MDR7403921.1 alkaline phosphatase family protein [Armatimonadota bacterium]
MRRSLWLLALLLAAVLAAGLPAAARTAVRHVVVLSADGARADAVAAAWPAERLAGAAYTWSARTTLPSTTLPSHVSMLSGVGTAVHGVRVNTWSPGQGYLDRPTAFTVAAGAGMATAAFVAKAKLRYLLPPAAVRHVAVLPFPRADQAEVARRAASYLEEARPHLLFVHVADPDAEGHRAGWMSEPYRRAVARLPDTVQVLRDALDRLGAAYLLILTADHGGHGRVHGSADPQDVTIPWIAWGAVSPGPLRRPVVTYDTAATVVAALGLAVPAGWQGTPVLLPAGGP